MPLREYFSHNYQVDVGLYSYGCFDAGRIGRRTVIGRYCSIAPTVHIFRRNHPISTMSMHPFLYAEDFGFPVAKRVEFEPCVVEDDVWLGHAAIVLPSVTSIGRGSVVGAGTVLTTNVPPYSIVVGNPGKIIKKRFDIETISRIEATGWWQLSAEEFARFCERQRDFVFDPSRAHCDALR